MDNNEQARQILRDLFSSQIQAVLATEHQHQPYTSLMAFTASDDLRRLLFATYRNTHKYHNLLANPQAAMLIDNRSGQPSDHYSGIAVTATGQVQEVSDSDRDRLIALHLARHPTLAEFLTAPACALMALQVACYYIVSQFHNVTELRLSPPDNPPARRPPEPAISR